MSMEVFAELKEDLKAIEGSLIDNWFEDAKEKIAENHQNESEYVKNTSGNFFFFCKFLTT